MLHPTPLRQTATRRLPFFMPREQGFCNDFLPQIFRSRKSLKINGSSKNAIYDE
jgi:hypothetical protein